ncbi:MAG: tetratricopeptide repeat protein [Microcoleus sp. PH2017_25_DOB_D_A]|uniref:tetratricopeptide repeat protein n=1 Tax=unclassified Microcoleus TaxID=2642155 RepID=UPI001DFF21DD|nr:MULTISPECIES: tetratricopeptide repeat protein [unclassified Microcoleus]MCC3537228.1 tetratricopeptide repeat protein [Microcoleus sp. PH2017_25_DOB_D_A]MCC3549537.1 tetratricopeptide repeat protein [Microcoleus sp. PH2017_24_DOB_U_A]TAE39772.1 MAG: tetratricopeptide repeat protein [Oscillatoriales cyanobacterium]TAE54223.1 MAG: tetratricopeptide repeat protein [Oscillatoriales cyanobacterium]
MNLHHRIPATLIGLTATIFIAHHPAVDAREAKSIAVAQIEHYDRVDLSVQLVSEAGAPGMTAEEFYNLAGQKYHQGDYQGAVEACDRAIKLNPNYANAYMGRGIARAKLGDKQGAKADFDQALKIDPNYALAYYNRGLVRDQLGDKQGAIADYDQALKIDPNNAHAYYNRGVTRSSLADKQGAIADYDQAIKINPDYAEAYANLGIARAILGDKQGAIQDLQKAADLFQKQARKDDYEKALNLIKRIQEKS